MKKIHLLAVSALTCLMGTAASAGVVVIGSSPGHGCYQSARAQNASLAALEGCNLAFEGAQMNFRDTVATHVNRGIVRLVRQDIDGAISDFDRAIALDPREAESYLNKASALLRKRESPAQAAALFTEALKRKTDRPELAYFGRAIAYEVSGDLKSAYLDYRRAQDAAPRWEDPARELSRFQVRRAGG